MLKINIEVSARHVHLSQKDIEKLFGRGYELKPLKKLSQPGQFAGKETVRIKTKKGEFDEVRVLGPAREETQIEISLTDSYELGVKALIRLSGDLRKTPGMEVIGPKGSLSLKKGVIIAKRHIHAAPEDGLTDGQKVSVKVDGERTLTFQEVIARVDENYKWACHIDTDEGNAAGISGNVKGEIIIK